MTYVATHALMHSPNPELRAALATLPELPAAEAALRRISAAVKARALGAPALPVGKLGASLAATLLRGEDIPASFDDEIGAVATRAAGRETGTAVLRETELLVGAARDDIVLRGAGALLDHLDRRVGDVVAAGRELDLRGATDAESAIARGVVTLWQQLGRHRTAYVRLCEARRLVVRDLRNGAGPDPATFGFVRNAAQLWPEWSDPATLTTPSGGTVERTPPPWPTDPGGEGDAARFDWLMSHSEAEAGSAPPPRVETAAAPAERVIDVVTHEVTMQTPGHQRRRQQLAAARVAGDAPRSYGSLDYNA